MRWLFFFFAVVAQSNYFGPKPPPHFLSPPATNAIRVQIQIYDDPSLGGARINEVSFNQTKIPLQAPDLHGYRGGGGFQVPAGKYSLNWNVTVYQESSSQTFDHKKTVTISKNDTWVQIMIQGEEASIS